MQARIRGTILMAISNKFATSADHRQQERDRRRLLHALWRHERCLGVIADVPKTMVYELAHCINRDRPLVPSQHHQSALCRIASEQTDQDNVAALTTCSTPS